MSKVMRVLSKGGLILAVLALGAGTAYAGTGGTSEFGTVYGMIQGWFTGTLGKIIAVSALGVGLGIGVLRQSIMAVVGGIAMAVSLYYGPTVVDSIIVAGIPLA